jgi:hypothetical protein
MTNYKRPSQAQLSKIYGFRPKRFVPSFAYFIKHNFDNATRGTPELNFADIVRRCASIWHDFSDEQKEPYR